MKTLAKNLAIFLLLTFALPVVGQTALQAGVTYQGPERLVAASLGLTFTLPAGWQGTLPQGESAFAMQSISNGALIMVTLDAATPAQTQQDMSQNIPIDQGIYLQPAGQLQVNGSTVSGLYNLIGAGQVMEGFVYVRHTEDGRAFGGVALMLPQNRQEVSQVAIQLIDNASISASQQVASSNAGNNSAMATSLTGRQLVRFYNGSGYSEKQQIWLCSNGQFSSSFSASSTSVNGSGAYGSDTDGTWQASGAGDNGELTLRYNNGNVSTYRVQITSEGLFLDGDKWFRDSINYCD